VIRIFVTVNSCPGGATLIYGYAVIRQLAGISDGNHRATEGDNVSFRLVRSRPMILRNASSQRRY
jgi:hypothetical protein